MQDELSTSHPELDIEILGVNGVFNAPGTEGQTADTHLPWLQDVEDAIDGMSVKDSWDATLRDVVILDANNVQAGTYNLTANDLSVDANYAELRELFVGIASSPSDPSSLSGFVYFDVNNNGVKDSSESAIGNVQVTLTNDGGQQSVTTEADGSYGFFGLEPGTYTLAQTQPALVIDGQETLGAAGGTAGQDQFIVELSAGMAGAGYNFGEIGREASTIQLIDLLSSPSDSGMITAVDSSSSDYWFCLEGEWKEYFYADVNLPADGADGTVTTRDVHGHDFQGSFDPTEPRGAYTLGENDTHTMLRIVGPLVDITAAGNGAEAESNVNAEGESLITEPIPVTPAADSDFVLEPIAAGIEAVERPSFAISRTVEILPPTLPSQNEPQRLAATRSLTEQASVLPVSSPSVTARPLQRILNGESEQELMLVENDPLAVDEIMGEPIRLFNPRARFASF